MADLGLKRKASDKGSTVAAPSPVSLSIVVRTDEEAAMTPAATEPAKKDESSTTIRVEEAQDEPHLVKQFGLFSSMGLALIIVNSWVMASMTLNVGMALGGPVVVLWGELIAAIGQGCVALCLSELCSVWPVSTAQYGWAYLVSRVQTTDGTEPKAAWWSPILSYFAGWLTLTGWCIMFSGAASITTTLTYAFVSLWHPAFVLSPWQFYLLFVLALTISLLINIFSARHLHWFDKVGIVWIALGGVVLVVATVACAGTRRVEAGVERFQSAEFVFTTFINTSDWGDFVLFMAGMVQPTFTITCFDAVAHVVDEMPNPRKDAPRCITMAVVFGALTTLLVLIPLLFVITDLDAVESSAPGPLLTILLQATGSRVGATCLCLIPFVAVLLQSQATLTTASRVVLTLAEDDALPFSRLFSRVNAKYAAPIPALLFPWAVSVVIGLLYLGSSAMFSSILSTTLVALGLSYIIPVIVVAIKGRSMLLDLKPQFSLGTKFGAVVYAVAIAWGLFTAVMFCFPATRHVDGSSLNYTAPVIGVGMAFATVNWFAYSRRVYTGPRSIQ